MELWPCAGADCGIIRRLSGSFDPGYDGEIVSDHDIIAEYTDTITDSRWVAREGDGRPHIPLNVKITQRSYSWSGGYAQDFILVDYTIQNIGDTDLEKAFVGLLVIPSIFHESKRDSGPFERICGFRKTYPSRVGGGYLDTIDIAWSADNDGDPVDGAYDYSSVTSATGLRIMRSPVQDQIPYFNWYTPDANPEYSWGPMHESNRRTFVTGGMGYATTDRERYYLMANSERDYDQIYAEQSFADIGWLPPSASTSRQLAQGTIPTEYVLSIGPFDIPAGDSVPLTIAHVGGERFHRRPSAFHDFMELQYDPDQFYHSLSFDDLAENAVKAYWVFDNPGVDTDGDGYAGPYWEIDDTMSNGEIVTNRHYYAGDGVPDFRAATPPHPPVLRHRTTKGAVKIMWNGLVTETTPDPFTGIVDFEGYRLYIGRLARQDALGLVVSHDICNYVRLAWDDEKMVWKTTENPITLDSLKKLYGDDFDPESYNCSSDGAGLIDDSVTYCFRAMDWNQTVDGWNDGGHSVSGGVRKTYADEIAAGLVTPDIESDDIANDYNWVRGLDPRSGDSIYYHKYYEYEFTAENLLSSVPWWFSVTAFDFGDVSYGIEPLESSPLANAIETWAINDASVVLEKNLDVIVYPNPYIGDGRYSTAGYEDPHGTGFVDHERRVHFLNLPPRCTVKIYTISGDLVREFDHPGPTMNTDSKLTWNLRSANNEIVTSGIYLYSVESEWGHKVGKIVIIL